MSHAICFTLSCITMASLIACGGGNEPTTTILRELPPAHGFLADGSEYFSYAPGPDASKILDALLRDAGIRAGNKRCSRATGFFAGQMVSFIEGIHPKYALYDIPVSDLAKARKLAFIEYSPEMDFIGTPFWRCEDQGY